MIKNTSGQAVSAQLVAVADGEDVTSGTTTVYVTGDAGTQASGGGTVTHEGNGCWSYQPTQAETNYDHVSYTFVNSSAVSVTIQRDPIILADYKATGFSTHDAAAVVTALGTGSGLTSLATQASVDALPDATTTAAAVEAAILDEGDATALLAAIAAKVESFILNDGDASATLQGIATAVWANATRTLTANTNFNDPTPAAIADAICDEVLSGHTTAGTLAKALSDILTDTNELQTDDVPGLIAALENVSVADILAGEGDTGVSLAKAIEIVVALAAGKVTASSAAGVTTLTYKKRDGTTTSFTTVVTESDKTRATTGALS
jgi:hypothetical protein